VLARLSTGYPSLGGRLPTLYSPVRRSTRFPKETFALDLHVLGTPPAFVLSQDQTLQLKRCERSRTPCATDRGKSRKTRSPRFDRDPRIMISTTWISRQGYHW